MQEADFTATVELVRSAQQGDRSALERLFERYYPRVLQIVSLRTGRRLRQITDVEDIAQDVLLKAFQGLERFEHRTEGSFRNWLARCVECAIVDRRREAGAAKRGGGLERRLGDLGTSGLVPSVLPAMGPTPSEVARGHELEARLEEALLALPEHHRELVILRQLCGMSYAEIAEEMRFAKEETARRACNRALEKLEGALGV